MRCISSIKRPDGRYVAQLKSVDVGESTAVYDTDEKFFLKGKTYVFENTAREFPSSIQARAHERKLFDEGQ
jgi:hypothetical protein